jgi:hypothetical protein
MRGSWGGLWRPESANSVLALQNGGFFLHDSKKASLSLIKTLLVMKHIELFNKQRMRL